MNDIVLMIVAFVVGLALGGIYFYGLWLTVKKAVVSKTPAAWVLLSFLLRTCITLAGFYYVSQGNWQRLLVCMSGFVIARHFVKRTTGRMDTRQIQLKKEVIHET